MKELKSRVDFYESLLDRLQAASDSERSSLLSAYAQNKHGKTSQGPSLSRQVDGTDKPSTQFKSTHGTNEGDTLTVLGCGMFGSQP